MSACVYLHVDQFISLIATVPDNGDRDSLKHWTFTLCQWGWSPLHTITMKTSDLIFSQFHNTVEPGYVESQGT